MHLSDGFAKSLIPGLTISVSLMLLLGELAFLDNSVQANGASSDALRNALYCEKMTPGILPYFCTLNHNRQFLGLQLNMGREEAFQALSKNAGDATWTSFISGLAPRVYSPNKAGLEPGDWEVLQRADTWMLRNKGAPCIGLRYITVRFVKNRVDYVDIQCDKISASEIESAAPN